MPQLVVYDGEAVVDEITVSIEVHPDLNMAFLPTSGFVVADFLCAPL